jgi:hypothetical protein
VLRPDRAQPQQPEGLRDRQGLEDAHRVAIGHAREVVDHALGQVGVGRAAAVGQARRVLDVVREQRPQQALDLDLLGVLARAEVDVGEHEVAQLVHRGAGLRALDDRPGRGRVLDEVVHQRVDAVRAGVAQDRDRVARQVGLAQHARADRVVDVVVDVGDAIDDPHDRALERPRWL